MRRVVVLTASDGSFPGLAQALRELDVPVEERPLLTFSAPLDWSPVDAAIDDAGRYEVVALTAPRAATALAARVDARGVSLRAAGRPALWVAGPATAAALGSRLDNVRLPDAAELGRHGAAEALVRAMRREGVEGPVLFPCGDHRRDELPARLRSQGIAVDEVVCYRSVLAGADQARAAAERAEILVVASPSVAGLLARSCSAGLRPRLLAVGPTTAEAARASGWPAAAVAARPATEALVASLRSLLATVG